MLPLEVVSLFFYLVPFVLYDEFAWSGLTHTRF